MSKTGLILNVMESGGVKEGGVIVSRDFGGNKMQMQNIIDKKLSIATESKVK